MTRPLDQVKRYTWSAAGLLRESGHTPEIGEQLVSADNYDKVCAERDQATQQERQRVQEELEGMVERQQMNSQDCGLVVPVDSIEAFIDTLGEADRG